MKYSRSIKKYGVEIVFGALIVGMMYVYFVVYLTPDRIAWYRVMHQELKYVDYELHHGGK